MIPNNATAPKNDYAINGAAARDGVSPAVLARSRPNARKRGPACAPAGKASM
jgi:hypothetical protein